MFGRVQVAKQLEIFPVPISRKSHDDSESYSLVGVEFWHVFGELFVVKVLLAVNIHLAFIYSLHTSFLSHKESYFFWRREQ